MTIRIEGSATQIALHYMLVKRANKNMYVYGVEYDKTKCPEVYCY